MNTLALGIVIGLVLQVILGAVIYNHLPLLHFVLAAGIIYLFALDQTIFLIYHLRKVLQLNYDAPIIDIQKRVERIKIHRIRILMVTRFSYALLWVPVLIVGAEILIGVDLYAYLNGMWLLIQVLIGFIFIGFGAWLSKRFVDQKITSPFLSKVVNNTTINDFTGRSLVSAMTFLRDIEAFEQEQ
jgi:hypothetical protein